jgi:uncharacterized membrane protein HdeD (DUF308 family)
MNPVREPQLETQGRRMTGAGRRWLLVGTLLAIPGIVLVVVGLVASIRWMWPVGIALLLIGSAPIVVAFSLLSSGAISRWAARHKLFA